MITYRIRADQRSRKSWAVPFGVAEGSDFKLSAKMLNNGALDTSGFTSSGTWTVTISDSVLNGGSALLTAEASDSFTKATGLAEWSITDAQSAGWQAGTYNGDIKLVDSASLVHYFPVSLKVRTAQ